MAIASDIAPACSFGSAGPSTAPSSSASLDWATSLPFWFVHLACLGMLWTGVTALSAGLCIALYVIRMFGITGAYHRYFSHRAYKTSRPFQFVLALLGCSAVQKGPLWWAGHHRHHHRYSDTEHDWHSPREQGLWWAHLGWILSHRSDATDWEGIHDFARYPELRWLNKYHWVPGIALAAACFLVGGWSGLVWGFFVSTTLLYHGTFFINSLAHVLGTRRYQTTDDSRNNLVLALITMGEGWHNNHHHYQSSANQGFFWWEIDVSYYILKLLSWTGLIWDLRKPPAKYLRPTA